MPLGKFFFVLGGILTFGLLATAQRMDSYDKSLTVRKLGKELETLNGRKQELILLIKTERERLIFLSQNMGRPLTPKDVVILENTP